MRALSASELLSVWERGLVQPAPQQALTLLAAASPDTPGDALGELSIGQRDARLLTLREWTFGPQLASLTTCPECGQRLDLTFNVADIQAEPEPAPHHHPLYQGKGVEGAKTLSLSAAGYEVHFRLPNSLDLIGISGGQDITATRRFLLERCFLAAQRNGEEATLDQLPEEVTDALVEHMAQADPQADIQLDLCCPACDHRWQAAFDIASFFWSEINAWAQRTLREVHMLARAYGWREADILAMSPRRRSFYLDLVGETQRR